MYSGMLEGRSVVAIVTGMGTELARRATARLLDTTIDAEHVVVVGIAGAVANDTPIGTVHCPETVIDAGTGVAYRPEYLGDEQPAGTILTSNELLTDPSTLADLRSKGVVALDMESAAVVAVCSERGVPCSVFRAISDRAGDGTVDNEIFGLAKQDGSPDLPTFVRYLVRHPRRIPNLARLAKNSTRARNAAAEAAISAVDRALPSGR